MYEVIGFPSKFFPNGNMFFNSDKLRRYNLIPELPFYNGVSWDYSPVRLPPMAIGTSMVSNTGLE